jgi:hypothetical protein
LQERLLKQSGAIESLAVKTLSQITGGNSYPVFYPEPRSSDGAPGLPLVAFVRGEYSLVDATVTLLSHTQRYDPQHFLIDQIAHSATVILPIISNRQATGLSLRVYPEGETDSYGIQTSTRNGTFNERLIIRTIAGKYQFDWTVADIAKGKILETSPIKQE